MALGAGLGAAVFLGGTAGLVTGGLLAAGLHRWLPRARSPAERRAELDEARLLRQLPLTAELLAACLGSAASPAAAVAAVGGSVGAPMGPRLMSMAAELALGAPRSSAGTGSGRSTRRWRRWPAAWSGRA